ncbi:MAG: right-handed parallel beta-helix repeat-containing protein [Candidatus Methylomirabilales bacterium]
MGAYRKFPIIVSLAVVFAVAMTVQANGAVEEVDCNDGDTITETLEDADPGDTIRVTGICQETVTITTDRLTLDGQGSAIIDGSGGSQDVVTIDGARGVTLTGLTIQNGREGILGINAATFTVDNTTVQGNSSHGIELVRASATLTNINSSQNGRAGVLIARNSLIALTNSTLHNNLTGLVVFSNSTARLFGTNVMSDNLTQGSTVGLGGAVFSIGSTILANDNGAEGLFLLQDGNIQLIGGTLEASRNGTDGINLLQNSSIILGIQAFGVPGTVVTSDNVRNGIIAASGSDVAGSQIMPLTSRDNGAAGVRLDDRSSATISGATIQANGTTDVDLSFGSQATLNSNTIGTIACDGTARLRGDTGTVCPTP